VWIVGIHIRVPPSAIELLPEIQLLPSTTVFDPEWIPKPVEVTADWVKGIVKGMTDWVTGIIEGKAEWFGNIARGVVDSMLPGIIQATFNAVEPYLDKLAEDFYRRRGT